MTYQPSHYRRTTHDPRAQVHPAFQFAAFEFSLAGGATRAIQVSQRDPFPAAAQNWLLGTWNILNFCIQKDQFSGLLRVDLSIDGALQNQQHVFPLSGESIADSVTGFELAGFSAQFIVQNGTGAASTIRGWIQVRSW